MEIGDPPKAGDETGHVEKILVLQQNGRGESKVQGIKEYGSGRFEIEIVSMDTPLPQVLDDTRGLLPERIEADLVLDFLKHPDLSHDLAALCVSLNIPLIASGKKLRIQGVHSPPT